MATALRLLVIVHSLFSTFTNWATKCIGLIITICSGIFEIPTQKYKYFPKSKKQDT